jgi:hypothetical protein
MPQTFSRYSQERSETKSTMISSPLNSEWFPFKEIQTMTVYPIYNYDR